MLFTLGVWAWILTRPAGTFHDQGGMLITFFYFPATFGGWMLFGLPSSFLARRKTGDESDGDSAGVLTTHRIVSGLVALGLLLSFVTLFIA